MLSCGGETPNPSPSPVVTGEGSKAIASITILFDMGSEWVTFWKNILSLFGGIDSNFSGEDERLEVGRWLENGLPTNLN